MRLRGRAALVTGAGSGIGRATAMLLARQGCMVAALEIDGNSLESLGDELKHFTQKYVTVCGDISRAQDVKDFVAKSANTFGRIDFLFNNAGVEFISPLDETTEEQWQHVHDTNMKGTFLMTKEVIPHMRAIGAGAIVNNASDAGLRGIKLNAAYSSSKAGIIHLTRSIALDYGKYNIRCNCICPGCIKTPLCERFNAEVGARKGITGEQALAEFVDAMIPMKRVGMPDEVAELVLFLFCDEASYISGAIIPIDGALTAGM
jgi:NAD(P)-dependent dehydrogenase (short-subunit alcohol dehydrogenase family)